MKIRWNLVFILSLLIAILPSPALANGGTALIHGINFFIGNAIIGYIEGGLLAKWFRIQKIKAIVILIIANYVSAFAGRLVLAMVLGSNATITIENIQIWFYIFLIISLVLTLIIEYPFFAFLLRKQQNAVQKAIKSTIILHSLSYFLVVGWYFLTTQDSIFNQFDIVSATQLQPQQEYVLYFMNPENNQAWRSNLQGQQLETLELSDFQAIVPQEVYHLGLVSQPNENTNWQYYLGVFSDTVGIRVDNRLENVNFKLNLEIPFAWWRVSHATHLEGDFLLFQLGDDQICILHPEQRKIALITRGNKPFVVKAQ